MTSEGQKVGSPARTTIFLVAGVAAFFAYAWLMPAWVPFVLLHRVGGSMAGLVWLLTALLSLLWASVLLFTTADMKALRFSKRLGRTLGGFTAFVALLVIPLMPGRLDQGRLLRREVAALGYSTAAASSVTAVMICALLMFSVGYGVTALVLAQIGGGSIRSAAPRGATWILIVSISLEIVIWALIANAVIRHYRL